MSDKRSVACGRQAFEVAAALAAAQRGAALVAALNNRGMGYIPDDDPLAQAIGRLHNDLAALRAAARLVVDAEYRREQWGSDTVATFDRAIQGLRESLK